MIFFRKLQEGSLLLAIIVPAWWLGASTAGGQWALLWLGALALAAGYVGKGAGLWARSNGTEGGVVDEGDGWGAKLPGLGLAGRWCVVAAVLFLGWVLVQALNPSHGLVPAFGQAATTVGGMPAELAERPHVRWLPSGLATPFGRVGGDAIPHGNAWRQLLVFGSAALLGAGVVLTVDRAARARRALEWGVLQGATFSAVALAHNLSGSGLTYWKYYDPVYRLGGPQFPHDNQQVAYQLLLLTVAVAACLVRGRVAPFPGLAGRRGWLIAAAVIVYAATVTSRPRSGLLLGTLLVVGALALKGWRARPERRRLVGWVASGGVIALGLAVVTVTPLRETVARFGELSDRPSALFTGGNFRPLQHRAGWLMVEERPWVGWGGGSYLYLSPVYSRRVPELMQVLRSQGQNHHPVFPHADGDWLEFLVEYGVLGTVLLATSVGAWAWWILARIRRLGTVASVFAAGGALVLAQGTIDPVLRNPAVLGAMIAAAWLAVVFQRMEEEADQ
jgi:O-antigen ligase